MRRVQRNKRKKVYKNGVYKELQNKAVMFSNRAKLMIDKLETNKTFDEQVKMLKQGVDEIETGNKLKVKNDKMVAYVQGCSTITDVIETLGFMYERNESMLSQAKEDEVEKNTETQQGE